MSTSAPLGQRAVWHFKDLVTLGVPYQLRHAHRRGRREFTVQIRAVGSFVLRPGTADAAVVSQVFSWRQYDTREFPQHHRLAQAYNDILARGRRPLILDLGANNGASARWFAHEYPEAGIVAVEPDPDNARICRLNTEGYRIDVLEAAIGGTSGTVSLHGSSDATVSFTTSRSTDGDVSVVTVQEIVASRATDHELFIVKVDIEGFEEDLFANSTEWVADAHAIMIEPHDWKYPDRDTSRNLQKTMGCLPFQLLIAGENLIYVRHR